jgi:8-hydroxy-5-deazaflavin:NADPH oxidoreductase
LKKQLKSKKWWWNTSLPIYFNWTPTQEFDMVFFGFWLSHVPMAQFADFWQMVKVALKPNGRVFFVDSLFDMKVAIIGSGIVGQALGKKLVELGHDVVLGTRDPNKLDEAKGWAGSLNDWLTAVGNKATVATFAAAAAQGEIIINATHGMASLAALQTAGAENLQGKILIDAAFPNTKVVKTLNTMNCAVMVNPKQLADGNHTVFVSGNDADAKAKVTELLQSFGWTDIFDLGDITSAR